jgi:hypothetical protein
MRIGDEAGTSVHRRAHARGRRAVALVVYSSGYPLLAIALWTGARGGNWSSASALVALAVFMSFLGWGLLASLDDEGAKSSTHDPHGFAPGVAVFLALYNRAGAIVLLLGSYAVTARLQGWPTPVSFVGWFALVWIPLFISFAMPVERASRRAGPSD